MVVGHGSRLWALRERGTREGRNPGSCRSNRAAVGAWLVTPGTLTTGKRRWLSPNCKASAPSGTSGASWRENPFGRVRGAILVFRAHAGRRNTPRPSCECNHPSRGDAGPKAYVAIRRAFAHGRIAWCVQQARGLPLLSAMHVRQGGVRSGSRRGLARRKTPRTFTRVGSVRVRGFLGSSS